MFGGHIVTKKYLKLIFLMVQSSPIGLVRILAFFKIPQCQPSLLKYDIDNQIPKVVVLCDCLTGLKALEITASEPSL